MRSAVLLLLVPSLVALSPAPAAGEIPGATWRYYRPGNTGIQGDFNEAIFVGADGDPWIGGYDPSFEEGGVAKLVQAENRWINISSVDYPVIGHPDLTGTARVSDIVADADGLLWMSTWRSALRLDPEVGASSLVNFASASPALANGGSRDLDIAPDGTIWFALVGFGGFQGGVVRHTPGTSDWHYWTGGAAPQGGNGWPQLVWNVIYLSVQPKPGGGYVVWADADNGVGLVSFDSDTQLWTHHPFEFVPGALLELPGKDCVDDAGNLWVRRFAGFVGNEAVYSLDVRTPSGSWIVPPQPTLPATTPPIWAFHAHGDGEALLADGLGRVWSYSAGAWSDFGLWGDSGSTYSLDLDGDGNVWAAGTGGAAKRDATTGLWQRYRVTNTSQFDLWNQDLAIDPATGDVYACANAGPGVGGMTSFDGTHWFGFNNHQYGLGAPWPFPSDNCQAVGTAAALGVVANPTYAGLHAWDGLDWSNLSGPSESRDLVEDSTGRLWTLGPYYDLRYYDGLSWITVPNNGAGGQNLQRDPDRPGTIWASTDAEVIRTDGSYRYARDYTEFPELDPQSDLFTTVAAAPGGVGWLGSTQGIFRLDAESGTYQYFTALGGISALGASPLAVSPDGLLWYVVFDPFGTGAHGLVWFDGTSAGIYPAPRGGEPQWGGLPHAQIAALEVRTVPGGYELWMSCLSRGIAVLSVPWDGVPVFLDGFESGDTAAWSFVAP
ncbi:MAG: SMP-30/Gluconolactonase/LRE-like region [Acidobacteria bacterium]|nr:SMP-30/Gluconolactonase/LRE-like region [Acidobacteriota bacterium]